MIDGFPFNRTSLKRSLQRSFVVGGWSTALLLMVALAGTALVGGALVTLVHPLLALVLPMAVGAALVLLRAPQWGLYATAGVAILLPFATLPVSIGFKPTFLDLALGATFLVWFMTLLAGRASRLRFASITPFVLAFIVVAVVAFVAGLQHAALERQILRRFLELILALLLFFVVVDYVRRPKQLEGLAAVVMICGFLSAAIGIGLYLLPHQVANGLLNQLGLLDYPTGFVLRFILDDPSNFQRAISTSVDPNVFGGLMILMAAVTAPQIAAERPIFPRWFSTIMVGTMVLALALTFSRGSMLGLVVAITPLMLLRYRRLIPWAILGGLALLALPASQAYIGHFIDGIMGRDLATQMRFGEYKDALRLIQRYPYLGVGFIAPPDIDLYLGVSSVYLLLAEQTGLIGLSLYLLANLAFFVSVIRTMRRIGRGGASRAEPLLLGLASAVFGALFAGIFDHHFFDPVFPHFATLYWFLMGLAVAAAKIGEEEKKGLHTERDERPSLNVLPLILEGAQLDLRPAYRQEKLPEEEAHSRGVECSSLSGASISSTRSTTSSVPKS